jgi:hypothetical protein
VWQETKPGEALRGEACKALVPFLFFRYGDFLGGVAAPGAQSARGTGCPSRLCQEGKRKLTESAKEFPKASAWQSPKGPFWEVLERRALPPRSILSWPLSFPLTVPRNFGTMAPCTSRYLARSVKLKRLQLGRGYVNSRAFESSTARVVGVTEGHCEGSAPGWLRSSR